MNNFELDKTLQLFFVDDETKSVVSLPCKCTDVENGMFWLEAKGLTATYGTHLFLTEKEAYKKAFDVFSAKAKQYFVLYNEFEKASNNAREYL